MSEITERVQELKTWPDYYNHLVDGSKTFEYRRNDRDFKIGDVLHLREWEPTFEKYTGREMHRRVTYILPTSPTFVILALEPLGEVASLAAKVRQLEAELKEKNAGLPGTPGQGNPLEPAPRREKLP